MNLLKAVNKMRMAGAKWKPQVGEVIEVPHDHYFFFNNNVPVVRIRRIVDTSEICGHVGWETVHPDDKSGLIVFVNERQTDRPTFIVITEVQPSVALAKEQAPET